MSDIDKKLLWENGHYLLLCVFKKNKKQEKHKKPIGVYQMNVTWEGAKIRVELSDWRFMIARDNS